jgi:hypothetical protein
LHVGRRKLRNWAGDEEKLRAASLENVMSLKPHRAHLVRTSIAATLASVLGLSLVVGVQALAQSPAPPAAPNKPAVPDLPKTYLPGLGEFMLTIQIHHAKLWHAAKAGNWPLAAYQLSEMKEVFEEVQDQLPKYQNIPVGDMIEAITTGPIKDMEKAVDEKKLKNFSAAYGKLTEACNDCHKAANRGFIQIRRPTRSTFDNEEFRPRRAK